MLYRVLVPLPATADVDSPPPGSRPYIGRGRDGVDVNNPYQGPPPLPPWMDTLKRLVYISISAYGLQYFNFFKALLKSPHVRHGWFQVGLACTIGR